jgi:DNA polymerase, archaea type
VSGLIHIEKLEFTKRLSKNSNEYQENKDTLENNVLRHLESEGKALKAGEILKYVITNYYYRRKRSSNNDNNNRAIPIELFDDKNNNYDVRRYTELLAETCNSITEPFDHTLRKEQTIPLYHY